MRFRVQSSDKDLPKSDLLVVFGLESDRSDFPPGVEVSPAAKSGFVAEFRDSRVSDALAGPAERILQVGLGKRDALDAERLRRAAALAVRTAEGLKTKRVVLLAGHAVLERMGDDARVGQVLAEGAVLGAYSFTRFKSDAKAAEPKVQEVTLVGPMGAFAAGAKRGQAIAEANAFTRDLQNAPGNLMRPRDLVAAAKSLAKRSPRITCSALGESEMQKLGMGSLLSVSRGSEEPAFLIHLVHKPKGRSQGRIAIVGKGLTFDAGGISLKPAAKMDEMKYDMSGGAAVLGTFHALAELELPFEVHGFVPTSENLPDGKANKPGDIVTAYNKKTIEVLNTDAEGRLILCDALAYAEKKVQPDTIIDLATLTGAVVIALGHELSGCISENEALSNALVAAGKTCGELVWPLPLLEVHKKHMKGATGDLRNINNGQGAGSTAGAAFLSYFVEKTPWAHLDIAGTAWGAEERDYQGGSSGTGVGVRLLIQYLEDRASGGAPGTAPKAPSTRSGKRPAKRSKAAKRSRA